MGSERRLLLAAFGFIMIDALAQVLSPAVFRVVLNRIQQDPDGFLEDGWQGPVLAAVAIGVTFVIAAYTAHTFNRVGAARWANTLRVGLYEHAQRLSADFFQRSHVGDVAARMTQDVERLETSAAHALSTVWSVTMLLMSLVLMAWVDTMMAIIGLGLLAVAVVWSALVLPRLRRKSRAVRSALGSTSGTLSELLGLNFLIKAFNGEAHAKDQVHHDSSRVLEHAESFVRSQYRYSDFLGLHVGFIAPFVLLFVGAWRASEGTLLIGDVVAVWAFWQRAAASATNVLNYLPEILAGMAAADRSAEVYEQDASVRDSPAALPLELCAGEIRFERVSFAYPGRPDHLVLDGFDLRVGGGERVALVGPSGAGKSTVAQLLLRFYDPSCGRVCIDGQDLRDVQQSSVRGAVGIVFQDNVLLGGTLARNLRLAKPDATDTELRTALEEANAWDFVRTWEGGLDTEVGERGALMSGGQRQRLAIARVMLKRPSIVLLDEATNALDAESERLVLDALERLMVGRTSVVIAHRIATVRAADRIVLVERGRVVDEGTHDALVRSSATYRSYCQQQLVT